MILAGGAIGSPHILQLSGVGDPAHLARAGISVQHALPGVGKNLQDHFIVRVVAMISGMKTLNERSRGLPFAGEILRYLLTGTGMLTYAASLVAVSAKVLEDRDPRRAVPVGAAASRRAHQEARRRARHDRRHVADAALSTGYVEAKSPDPRPPAINPRYLSEETDRRRDRGSAGAAAVRGAGPGAPHHRRETARHRVQSDDELLDYARQTGSTVFHASCACKMGQDSMAVVDDELRVHGLEVCASSTRR